MLTRFDVGDLDDAIIISSEEEEVKSLNKLSPRILKESENNDDLDYDSES